MITRFEHFAVTDLMAGGERPPRQNGDLCFAEVLGAHRFWNGARFGKKRCL